VADADGNPIRAIPEPEPKHYELEVKDLWLGRCRVCGTSVLVDDEHARWPRGIVHRECASFWLRRRFLKSAR